MIPPDTSAAFVADMEDVLEVYQRPHDPQCPLVCLDETSKQLIIETRAPIPAKPGRKARHDYEYERNGVANLFMVFAPLEGWRLVKVTAPRPVGRIKKTIARADRSVRLGLVQKCLCMLAFPTYRGTVSMEPAEELSADRRPIDNRHPPNRRAR